MDDCLGDYQAFRERMKAVFGDNDSVFIANQKLRVIKQRRLGVLQVILTNLINIPIILLGMRMQKWMLSLLVFKILLQQEY